MKGLWALSVVALVAAVPSTVEAQFFTETFDTYVTGSTIMGQGGWETWDNDPNANTTLSAAQSFSAPNSLLVAGTADIVHQFPGVTSGTWFVKTRVFTPSTQTGEAWFIVLNRYTSGAPANEDWSIQLAMCRANCSTTGVSPGLATSLGGSANPGTGTTPLVLDQWVEVRAVINLDANTYQLFYNGTLVESATYQVTGQNAIQAIDLFSNVSSQSFMDSVWLDTTLPVELTTFAVE